MSRDNFNELTEKQKIGYMFFEFDDVYYFDDTINHSTSLLASKIQNNISNTKIVKMLFST